MYIEIYCIFIKVKAWLTSILMDIGYWRGLCRSTQIIHSFGVLSGLCSQADQVNKQISSLQILFVSVLRILQTLLCTATFYFLNLYQYWQTCVCSRRSVMLLFSALLERCLYLVNVRQYSFLYVYMICFLFFLLNAKKHDICIIWGHWLTSSLNVSMDLRQWKNFVSLPLVNRTSSKLLQGTAGYGQDKRKDKSFKTYGI